MAADLKGRWAVALLALAVTMALAGCGVDKGEIPDSGGPPTGGPPANSEHPPGLTDAEKSSPATR